MAAVAASAERTNLQDVQPEPSSGPVKPQQRESSTSTEDHLKDGGSELLPQVMPSIVNHNDPKYKCCCGCMHARTGAIIIAIITWIIIFLNVAAYASNFEETSWIGIPMMALSFLHIIFIICLLIGAVIKNHTLVLVYTIYGCFSTIMLGVMALGLLILMIIGLLDSSKPDKSEIGTLFGIGITVTCIEFPFAAWWTWVAFKCYRYLRDLKQQNGMIIRT